MGQLSDAEPLSAGGGAETEQDDLSLSVDRRLISVEAEGRFFFTVLQECRTNSKGDRE